MTRITLEAHHVRFYSPGDETQFFSWLKQIPSVEDVSGRLDTILIDISSNVIDDDALRELLALFFRYKIDIEQLNVFRTSDNEAWFMDERQYWRRGRD